MSVRSIDTDDNTNYTSNTYRHTLPSITNVNEINKELHHENQLLKYQLEIQSLKLENQTLKVEKQSLAFENQTLKVEKQSLTIENKFYKDEIQLLKQQIVDKPDIKTESESKQTSTVSESNSEHKPKPEPCKESSIPETSSERSQVSTDSKILKGSKKENKPYIVPQAIKDIPKNKRIPFIKIEDEAIVKGVNKYGRRWTKIIEEYKRELSTVKERTGMNIKDRWDTLEDGKKVCEINGKWYIDASKY
jgi:FtsZ-binding cell division protein ZapB